jgi:hypothetical protein
MPAQSSDKCRVDGCDRGRLRQAGTDGLCRQHFEERRAAAAVAAASAESAAKATGARGGDRTPLPSDDDGPNVGGGGAPGGAGDPSTAVQPTPRRSNVHADGGGANGHGSANGGRRSGGSSSLPSPAKRSPMKDGHVNDGGDDDDDDCGGGSSSSAVPTRRNIDLNTSKDGPQMPVLDSSCGDEASTSSADNATTSATSAGAPAEAVYTTKAPRGIGGRFVPKESKDKDDEDDDDKSNHKNQHKHHHRHDHGHHHSHHHHQKSKDKKGSDDEKEGEKEDESTLDALQALLTNYRPGDVLDDDEILNQSKKAHNAYQRAMDRRRDHLIFGYDDSSDDDSVLSGGSGTSSSAKTLGLLLAEVADDADPEEAMWRCGGVEEKFFDSVVVSAAVAESNRRLAAEQQQGGAGADDPPSSTNFKAGEDNDADPSSQAKHMSDDEKDEEANDDDDDDTDNNSSAANGSPRRRGITSAASENTPISIKTSGGTPKRQAPKADTGVDGSKAPRVVMDDPTLDELRRNLGLRESDFVFSSTGRRRKHHYIRPRRRHRHHYGHMHHHGTQEGGGSDDNYDGDEDETEGVSRALGRESKPQPTRVTRRLTKAHREKKKEERNAKQLRGLETLAEEAMKLEVTIDGSTMSTAKALTSVNFDASEESSAEEETRGFKKRKYSTDGNQSSSDDDDDVSGLKRKDMAYDMVGGRRPGKNEEVPLYAMVPAAEYGRTRRRAGCLTAAGVSENEPANINYDSDEIWDGGTAFRPVTVTRIIVNAKPVYLAKLSKQISDAAKSRREREKTENAGWALEDHLSRQKRYEELQQERAMAEARAVKKQRKVKSVVYHDQNVVLPLDDIIEVEETIQQQGEAAFDETGPIFPDIVTDFRMPQIRGKIFNQPVSLKLLDWQQRQQRRYEAGGSGSAMNGGVSTNLAELDCQAELEAFPSAYRSGRKRPASEIASALDPSGEPWVTVSGESRISKQHAPTVEAPRQRHTDATYASWCSQLVHCLSSSGRNMARYEFFYSDLDRSWFNYDTFAVDVARAGIPKDAHLTRTEKSLVRRGIKGRPRCFSRRFAKSQTDELNNYRQRVRKIQRGAERQIDGFPFDVVAAPRIGSTVSALNKRARIIHRGVVLNKHPGSNGYLIQFERKDLGYEFCPDTEVAAHGVPSVILQASHGATDGSSMGAMSNHGGIGLGTTYGPLAEMQKGWDHEALSEMRKPSENMIVRSSILKALQKPTAAMLAVAKARGNEHVVDKVTEREVLVQIMENMTNLQARKRGLLDALDVCHQRWQTACDSSGGTINATGEAVATFKKHYAWLHANLQLTNESISSVSECLRIMYGKTYSAGEAGAGNAEEGNAQRVQKIEASLRPSPATRHVWKDWAATATEGSKNIGNGTASILESESSDERRSTDGNGHARLDFMQSRLSSAAALLQMVQLCGEGCSISGESKPADPNATGLSLQEALRGLTPEMTHGKEATGASEIDLVREESYRDLTKAVAMLQAEVAAQKNIAT